MFFYQKECILVCKSLGQMENVLNFAKQEKIHPLQVFISLGFKDIVPYNFNDVLSAKRPFKRSDTIHFYT